MARIGPAHTPGIPPTEVGPIPSPHLSPPPRNPR